tara:strand:- start:143 stop:847 length:705 start_codon:yes stop_codon:yes gene_type:complete
MAETYIIENVEALWPKIDKTYTFDQSVKRSVPCGPRDQGADFSIAFRMNSATAKALFVQMKGAYDANKEPKWADKLVNPFVKDDNGTYTHKANLKGAYKGEVTNKPLQVDSQGTPLPDDFQLTTGSTVSIAVQLIPYDFGGKQNVSLRLKAVQVIKYVPMEVRNPFGAVDGGFVMEDANPFASTPKVVKSNNVLDEAPADDEFDEEPVKRTATKAAPAPVNATDISSIVDNWDD